MRELVIRVCKKLVFIYILCMPLFAAAQATGQKIDSLQQLLGNAKADSSKVKLYCELSGHYFQTDPSKGVAYGEEALTLSKELNYDYGLIIANLAIGRCYAIQSSMPQALKYFQNGLVVARKLKRHEDEGRLLSGIGSVYKFTKEYDASLKYFNESIQAYKAAGQINLQRVMNNIGSLYYDQGKHAQSIPYYMEGIKMEKADKANPADLAILYNNVGGSYAALKKHDSALYYLHLALSLNERAGNYQSTVYSLTSIGYIYLEVSTNKTGNLPDSLKNTDENLVKAMTYETRALELCKELGMLDQEVRIYYNIINILTQQGKYKDAMRYVWVRDALIDSQNVANNAKNIATVEAEFKVQITTDSLKYQNLLKDNELKQKRNERNIVIGLIVLVGLVSVFLINRQKMKYVQKTKIDEELARQQLADFTQRIHEKNQLIEAITVEIEKHKRGPEGEKLVIDHALLNELQQSILLTDEQWDKFKNTFDKVYIGYYNRLREKMPEISPAETRFVLLSKMNLNNKEMAGMLGVSISAIRMTKHRLMKKLSMENDTELDSLIRKM